MSTKFGIIPSMDMQAIKKGILKRVKRGNNNFSIWTIGLTHDLIKQKEQHNAEGKDTKYWQQWKADLLSDAQEIERFFIEERGMKRGTGGDLNDHDAVHVYIF